MATTVYVNQSTSVVQIDSSQIVSGIPAVVYLSTLNAPGSLVTIRDIAGQVSLTKQIVVSTTYGNHYLDGPNISSYTITQPYGFLTVNPKTSSIWAVTNTFAFPAESSAATIQSLTATRVDASTIHGYEGVFSTALISSLSSDAIYINRYLSSGKSTILNEPWMTGGLRTYHRLPIER